MFERVVPGGGIYTAQLTTISDSFAYSANLVPTNKSDFNISLAFSYTDTDGFQWDLFSLPSNFPISGDPADSFLRLALSTGRSFSGAPTGDPRRVYIFAGSTAPACTTAGHNSAEFVQITDFNDTPLGFVPFGGWDPQPDGSAICDINGGFRFFWGQRYEFGTAILTVRINGLAQEARYNARESSPMHPAGDPFITSEPLDSFQRLITWGRQTVFPESSIQVFRSDGATLQYMFQWPTLVDPMNPDGWVRVNQGVWTNSIHNFSQGPESPLYEPCGEWTYSVFPALSIIPPRTYLFRYEQFEGKLMPQDLPHPDGSVPLPPFP